MELPEQGERAHRPELDGIEPSQLFLAVRAREQWIRARVSQQQLPVAVDHFIEETERYITATFQGAMPEVDVISSDVTQTLGMYGLSAARYGIEVGPRPLEGDDAVLNAHSVRGRLFGFHRGTANDIRLYVDVGLPQHELPGGVYNEYLSVSLEHSTVRLADEVQKEEERRLSDYIREQLVGDEGGAGQLFARVVSEIHYRSLHPGEFRSTAQVLQRCAPVVTELERYPGAKQQLVDAVLDYIALKLHFDVPHTVEALSHRIVVSDNGYRRGGSAKFHGIEPRLCLMGETRQRMVGVFFSVENPNDGKNGRPQTVQVPVQYIESIHKS